MKLEGKPATCVWSRAKGRRTLPRGLARPDDWIVYSGRSGGLYGETVVQAAHRDVITTRDPVTERLHDVARKSVTELWRPGNPLDKYL